MLVQGKVKQRYNKTFNRCQQCETGNPGKVGWQLLSLFEQVTPQLQRSTVGRQPVFAFTLAYLYEWQTVYSGAWNEAPLPESLKHGTADLLQGFASIVAVPCKTNIRSSLIADMGRCSVKQTSCYEACIWLHLTGVP